MTKSQLEKRVAELEAALRLAADPAGYWCRSCGRHCTDICSSYRNMGHKASCAIRKALEKGDEPKRKSVKEEVRVINPDCQHVEPPVMSEEEIRQRTSELQIRHWCPGCDRKIFSQFYMEWSLKHKVMRA